jgi:hypothetical protein
VDAKVHWWPGERHVKDSKEWAYVVQCTSFS